MNNTLEVRLHTAEVEGIKIANDLNIGKVHNRLSFRFDGEKWYLFASYIN